MVYVPTTYQISPLSCHYYASSSYICREFQSTHLQEVRLDIVSETLPHLKFQSTHLQEVRLKRAASILQYMYVSIHAPTRGATEVLRCLFSIVTVSIHAPTRGATDVGKFRCDFTVLFQSTHLQEVRLAILSASVTHAFVSIHAPTRGATGCLFSLLVGFASFNPRTYKRCDIINRLSR